MNRRTFHTRRWLGPLGAVVLGVCTLAAAMPAMAQSTPRRPVELVPPTPPLGKSDIPWMPYIMAILLLAIVVGVNFIPSKRGHQD